MPISKDGITVTLWDAPIGVGLTQTSLAMDVGYGCSIVGSISNLSPAPTLPCSATLQVSADQANWYSTDNAMTAGLAPLTSYYFRFSLAPGGVNAGDWAWARLLFTGNTGNAVNAIAYGSHTSST